MNQVTGVFRAEMGTGSVKLFGARKTDLLGDVPTPATRS